ncbi:kremen protein 2 isoform X3 [Equus quagga]|uniref:kremen protein 2 isoform X3 n=1 Tax=Equus quagga TaxID=89248 RepID=UPI001EE1BE40|nr:kremen protein 2 isoform X3 [Equus quagga]
MGWGGRDPGGRDPRRDATGAGASALETWARETQRARRSGKGRLWRPRHNPEYGEAETENAPGQRPPSGKPPVGTGTERRLRGRNPGRQITPELFPPPQTESAAQSGTRIDGQGTTSTMWPGRPRSDPGGGTRRVWARATSPWFGAMGTRARQGLLLLLLLLRPLLPPRGTSAGSLHSPGLSECFQVNGADYRGHQNRTGPRGAGRPCLFWDQTQQHSYSSASDPQGRWGLGAHNFCRNPDGDVQPWCYVAETEEGIYWRYCDIPTCHSEWARLDEGGTARLPEGVGFRRRVTEPDSAAPSVPGYLGCFVDSGAPPALSGPSGTSTKLTVQVCLRFCRMKGYQLAGVEAGYACFCGSESDLARGRPAPATDCDQICFGHPGQLCGGDGRLGIYEVSVGSCQGNWTAPQGVIYSPDFPDEYGPDRNCSWALGPPGAALELTFRLFELADPRDRLELRDAASGRLLRAFDGARPPPPGPLRLRAASLLLTFRSDARGHAQGFALTYRGEAPPDPPPPAPPPPCFTPLSAGLQDAAEDRATPRGSAQTPAAPLEGANVSCSPRPGAPEAAMGGTVC